MFGGLRRSLLRPCGTRNARAIKWGRMERAARARMELDALVDHLARSSGLRGASRHFADDTERARVSVHKALKRALRAIAAADPAVGNELAACVFTGFRCVYRPM